MMFNKSNLDLTSGPLLPSIISYSIPLILSGLLQIFFNAADLAIVGNFSGTRATAAVGATGSFIYLIVYTVMGLSNGANVVLARAVGAKESDKTSKIVHTAMTFSVFAGIVVAIIGALISPIAMDITKCPIDAKEMAIDYLTIYFAGAPAIFVYNFGSAILRTKGDTQRPLNFLMLSGVVNVLLNMFFVIVLGMSADGVALATTLSQYLAAYLTVRCLMLQDDATRLVFSLLRIHKDEFLGIIRYGVPSGLTNAVYSLSNIQIQTGINGFGSSVVAGNSAASSLGGFIESINTSMNSTALAFVGQNIGADNKKRIKRIVLTCLLIATLAAILIGNVMFIFGDPLYKIYVPNDSAAISVARERCSIMFTLYFVATAFNILGAASQAFGYSMYVSIISIFGIFGIRTIWMNTVFTHFGTYGSIIWCYPFTWSIILIGNAIVFYIAYNRYIKKGQLK